MALIRVAPAHCNPFGAGFSNQCEKGLTGHYMWVILGLKAIAPKGYSMLFRLLAAAALITAPAHADVWSFATPSKNIECWVGESFDGSDLHCTIFQKSSGAPAPRPAGCTAAWGHTFQMDERGFVQMTCENIASQGRGAQSVAEYGVTGRFGGFTCFSSRQGLECRNLDGHGFFLSRARQSVF